MRTDRYKVKGRRCNCRSVGECTHLDFSELYKFNKLVWHFAEAIKKKFSKKVLEGYHGWDDPKFSTKDLMGKLKKHIDKGDMIDVGVLAVMIWNRQE